jgi:hypothetical protein
MGALTLVLVLAVWPVVLLLVAVLVLVLVEPTVDVVAATAAIHRRHKFRRDGPFSGSPCPYFERLRDTPRGSART